MEKLTYEVQFTEGIDVRLALLSYIEDNAHVIYSPALDLYGYGNDELEARNSFSVVFEEYISYTTLHNTLAEDLSRLGWLVNKEDHSVTMPGWTDLLGSNPHLNNLMTNRPFKKFDQPTRLPAFV